MSDKQTLEHWMAALTASIAHWERLKQRVFGEHTGPSQCACCNLPSEKKGFTVFVDNCEGCPIFAYTSRRYKPSKATQYNPVSPPRYCADTPYREVAGMRLFACTPFWEAACNKEIRFLKKVRKYWEKKLKQSK